MPNPDKVAKPSRSKITTKVELGTKWEKFPTNDHHLDDLHPSNDNQCCFHEDHYENLCRTTKGSSNCGCILKYQCLRGNCPNYQNLDNKFGIYEGSTKPTTDDVYK